MELPRSVTVRLRTAFLAIMTAASVSLVSSNASGTAAPTAAAAPTAHLGAVLVGGTEVPGPGDPDGFGFADVRVTGTEVCWRISVNSVGRILAAHIHAGPRGVSGPVVVALDRSYRSGCVETPRRTARFLREHPSEFYVNVHNAAFPAGALRGQLRG
jgi:hypothetical protein